MPRVESAARHFNDAAEVYERSRPEYPAAAIDFLRDTIGLRPGRRVLDLGAGTGKLSRAILATGVDLVAVEPLPKMREVLHRTLPEVTLLDGVAEAIPLPDATLDAVVSGQAFHWFHGPEALQEIARVLRPDGCLALLWNVRDESVRWVKGFTEILEPHRRGAPARRDDAWRSAFPSAPFSPLVQRAFHFVQVQDRRSIVDRALSVSFIAGLPPEEKQAVMRQVEILLDNDPETAGRSTIDFPYQTEVYWCQKIGRARTS